MLIEIIIAITLGIVAGTFTGLIPGIHINLVAVLLFISSSFFLKFTTPLILAIFIVAMSITHTFMDFLPSIFLGAPDDETALSVLPGHRMVLKGEGYAAIKLTVIGSMLGLVIICLSAYFFIIAAPILYTFLTRIMAFILISLSLLLILKEKGKLKFFAFIIFALSGMLGFATLNFSLIKQPLYPLFTGLFGTALLSISFLENVKIPKQKITKVKIEKKEIFKISWLSLFSSSLVSFLPGLGSAQAATIASSLKKVEEKSFLILLGAINTIVLCLSFVALYAIHKPRTGVAVFIGKFLPTFNLKELWILLAIAFTVGIIVSFLTLFFAKAFSNNIIKIKYKWLCFYIILFLIVLTPIISGWFGLIILIVATALGIFCSLIGVKKIFLMGSLLIPVIIYYIV